MSYEQMKAVKEELKYQMGEAGVHFGVECMEDYYDRLDEAAEYITDVYTDLEAVDEKVEAWLEDTRRDYPETLVSFV